MMPIRRKILIQAFQLSDLAIVALSLFLAFSIISNQIDTGLIGRFFSTQVSIRTFGLFLCFLFIWHIIFSAFKLYRSRRLSTRWREVVDVFAASSLGTLVLFVMAGLLRIETVTPLFLTVFIVVSSTITVVNRLMLRWGLAWIRTRGRNLRFVLILGTNSRAVQLARKIEAQPRLGYRLIGFVDEVWEGTEEFKESGYHTVSDFNDFPAIIRSRVVDEVWVVIPVESFSQQLSEILTYCHKFGIITRFYSNIINPEMAYLRTEQFEGTSFITQYPGAMEGWPVLVKRLLDIILSMIFLILFSPIFVSTAILIKITSHGPVFFVQERIGLNKRRFKLYKFRTMTSDAEKKLPELEHLNEITGPVFKIKDDPRITRIGRFLRGTSVDELPQLFNVLMGDMSLVGPRPLPVRDYEGFYRDRHRRRFCVPPGITCLWQVQGRSTIPFEKWMELDLKYIDQWSLCLDLKILLKTIPVVLKGSGAA